MIKYYNNTIVPTNWHFYEDMMCSSYLATEMWEERYYELLEHIADDYE